MAALASELEARNSEDGDEEDSTSRLALFRVLSQSRVARKPAPSPSPYVTSSAGCASSSSSHSSLSSLSPASSFSSPSSLNSESSGQPRASLHRLSPARSNSETELLEEPLFRDLPSTSDDDDNEVTRELRKLRSELQAQVALNNQRRELHETNARVVAAYLCMVDRKKGTHLIRLLLVKFVLDRHGVDSVCACVKQRCGRTRRYARPGWQ